jgi:CheY-like chemotaxis protein
MQILIVDDDPLAAELSAAILQAAGYHTCIAEQALDALEQLATNPALSLIVSDMHMPLMNGIELFAEVRERGYPAGFILLTGDDPDGLRAEQPGLDACLMKDASLEHSLPRLVAELAGTP